MAKETSLRPSSLASYAVIKSLTDSKNFRNSYEILAEFIKQIIIDENLHQFSLNDIVYALKIKYGFDNIPIAAIKTSIKRIEQCTRENEEYIVNQSTNLITDEFKREEEIYVEKSQNILRRLKSFAKTSNSDFDEELLEELFIQYLLNDSATMDNRYAEVISRFIISTENDEGIKHDISLIREGSILFCGLAYNIGELGSIKNDLTLFLDTEILFSIMGYNGTLYQQIAQDLVKQVKLANSKQVKIRLKYFNDVEIEIRNFFASAESYMTRGGGFVDSIAMKSILNGCESVSDVRVKEADFFTNLKNRYCILADDKQSYYEETDRPYNLDIPTEFPQDDRSYEAIKYISHINVLRKGNKYNEYTTCRYLFVTETRRVQEISNALNTNDAICGYALPTGLITNILWFKLGLGFSSKEYPSNVNASYKARSIISREISTQIAKLYNETKLMYKNGEINQEQLAGRIVFMKEKSTAPEDITKANMDELTDFSPEQITKYEDGVKLGKIQNEEKQKIIDSLEKSQQSIIHENNSLTNQIYDIKNELQNKQNVVDEQGNLIKHQHTTIIEQTTEIDRLREQNIILKKEQKRRMFIKKFAKKWCLITIMFMLSWFALACVLRYMSSELISALNMHIVIVSLLVLVIPSIWKAKSEYKSTMDKINNNTD